MRCIAISAIWLDFLTIQLFPSCSISSFFYPNCVYMSFTIIWKKIYITVDHRSYYYYMKVYYFFGVLENHESMREILSNFSYVMFLLHNSFFLTRFKLKFSLFFMCFVFFIYFCLFRFIRSKSEQYFFAATQPSALIHPVLGVLHYLLWFQFACHSRVENRKLVFFFLSSLHSEQRDGRKNITWNKS